MSFKEKFWPIKRFELKKFIPLLLMKFFISFNYGILTSMKDTFIVTAKGSGAEVIPVLKGWIVLPIALGVTLLYTKLSNHLKKPTLFYGIILTFLTFIFVYAFILYPNRELLSPHASADWLTNVIGTKHQHWVSIYRNWMQVLFFVMAELWSTVAIFLLFWGFANQINRVSEAKRFYTLFIAGGDLAAIATGPLVWHYSKKYAGLDFTNTLQSLAIYIIIFGFIIIGLYRWITKNVLTDPKLVPDENPALSKTKLSLKESIKLLARSKYLRSIAMMVIGYGLTINLIEVTWKAHLKMQYPNPSDYQSFMANITSSVGIVSFLTAFLAGSSIIRFFGWRFSALITPVSLGLTGIAFLTMVVFKNSLPLWFGMTPLFMIVLFGAFQNISTKVMKYSFFDPTKEIAYIPLDPESKVKGKAAIDIVGSRFGKSGSAWIQILLLEFVGNGSVLSITYFLFPIIILALIKWIGSVRTLDKQFKSQKTEEEVLQEEPAQS